MNIALGSSSITLYIKLQRFELNQVLYLFFKPFDRKLAMDIARGGFSFSFCKDLVSYKFYKKIVAC